MGYGTDTGHHGHVHEYSGRTSIDFGHLHGYSGVTGVSFGLEPHTLKGTTTFNNGHEHNYAVITGPGIPIASGLHVHRYYTITTANGRGPHVHRLSGITAPAKD